MGRSRASKDQMGLNQFTCKKSEGGVPVKAKSPLLKKQEQMTIRKKGEKSQ